MAVSFWFRQKEITRSLDPVCLFSLRQSATRKTVTKEGNHHHLTKDKDFLLYFFDKQVPHLPFINIISFAFIMTTVKHDPGYRQESCCRHDTTSKCRGFLEGIFPIFQLFVCEQADQFPHLNYLNAFSSNLLVHFMLKP